MKCKRIVLLASIALIIGNIFGCASTPSNSKSAYHELTAPNSNSKSACHKLTAPNSYKVYLFVSNEYNSPDQIVQALENNTAYALLQQIQDVKLVKDLEAVGRDGVLLHIDIIGSLQSGISKRIAIRYQIINNATKETMIKEKDEIGSKFGYNKITIALGRGIAMKVSNLFSCFERRGKEPS